MGPDRAAATALAALALGAELLDLGPAASARRAAEFLRADRDPGRRQRLAVLREVRSDLLELVRADRRPGFDRGGFEERIAAGLYTATDKLAAAADPDTVRAWRRGMVLRLIEVPVVQGPPRVLATVDGGPGVGPVTVEWDSCERRVALVARLASAGVPPAVICDRLLADLSMSSPLRYSYR